MWVDTRRNWNEMKGIPDLETGLHQKPRCRRRQSRSHRAPAESPMEYLLVLEGSRAKCRGSEWERNIDFIPICWPCRYKGSDKLTEYACLLFTCTMEFSGIGVMVLKLFLIFSRQRGTYFSNIMVRWAFSVWRCLCSIQLATYLRERRNHFVLMCCSKWVSFVLWI